MLTCVDKKGGPASAVVYAEQGVSPAPVIFGFSAVLNGMFTGLLRTKPLVTSGRVLHPHPLGSRYTSVRARPYTSLNKCARASANPKLKALPMTCALCSADTDTTDFAVPDGGTPHGVALCATCLDQQTATPTPNHWRCLSSSMWSEDAATQVLAYRMLHRLSAHDWARDLMDMLYLDDETRAWAEAGIAVDTGHKDSNGVPLAPGDTVVLVKDLQVKGAGFTAKRGTAVRGISLVMDNPAHIEGRVEGQRIVILTEFVKKK